MKTQYFNIQDGEWFEPGDSFRMVCCDCGLAHDVEFRNGRSLLNNLELKMTRNKRSTANVRRHMRGWKISGESKVRCK